MPSRYRRLTIAALCVSAAAMLSPAVVRAETDDEVDLLRAAQLDNVSGVSAALARGANPNVRDGSGETALIVAMRNEAYRVASLLMKQPRIDLEARAPNGNTALMFAAGLGYRDGNMAVPTRDRGTPEEAIAAIQLCLDRGAQINEPGANGDTALHVAVTGRGDLDIIRYLVEHGASIETKNTAGQTALDAARASRRDRTAAAVLLESLAKK